MDAGRRVGELTVCGCRAPQPPAGLAGRGMQAAKIVSVGIQTKEQSAQPNSQTTMLYLLTFNCDHCVGDNVVGRSLTTRTSLPLRPMDHIGFLAFEYRDLIHRERCGHHRTHIAFRIVYDLMGEKNNDYFTQKH